MRTVRLDLLTLPLAGLLVITLANIVSSAFFNFSDGPIDVSCRAYCEQGET